MSRISRFRRGGDNGPTVLETEELWVKNIFLDKKFPLSYFCIQNSEFKINLCSREGNIPENASPDQGIEEPDREETGR
jgi:hypothetical protein